ncbi:MAG TPA: MG2 domain-containing protein, partial [Gemmatimonadales bacterium]|nr:MG2 domain-containing protein [Gemmatimonadales bacterium]
AAGCRVDPTGPITVTFTTPVRGADVARYVTIRPAARVAVDDTTMVATSFSITPDALRPRTGYAVVVDPALHDVFGQPLTGNPVTVAVTSGYAPSLDYATGRMLVERNGYRTLAVRHVNVDTLYVAARPVSDSMYAEMLKRGPWGWGSVWDRLDSTAAVRAIRVHADSDRSMITGVPLPQVDASRPAPPAAYAVKIRRNLPDSAVAGGWRGAPVALVQVTDLAVTSRAGGSEATVWVTGVGDGRARSGVHVELHAAEGRRLAQGTTDSTGLVRFRGVRGLEGAVPDDGGDEECDEECGGAPAGGAYVTATLGGDRAVLGVNESAYDLAPWQFNAYAAYGIAKYQVAATVFTERDIYRPGEPVYAKAIVRAGPLGALRPPAGDSVKLVFSDRDGGTLASAVHRLSEFGTTSDSIRLPGDAKLGQYTVSAQLYRGGRWQTAASDGYRVAEYRAPEFLVSASSDSGALFPGDSVRTTVEARYLFGAPMGRAAVHWTARLTPDWYDSSMIPGLGDGWYLGAGALWWEQDRPETSVTSEGTDTLDAAGRLTFTAPAGAPPKGRPASVAIEVTVTDVNRRSAAATTSTRVHPASFYLAAKPTGDYFWTGGKPQRVDLLAVRPDGHKVAGVAVTGTIIRREWHQVARTRYGYSAVE